MPRRQHPARFPAVYADTGKLTVKPHEPNPPRHRPVGLDHVSPVAPDSVTAGAVLRGSAHTSQCDPKLMSERQARA